MDLNTLTVVNLTPHTITVNCPDGKPSVSFPPSGITARLQTLSADIDGIGDCPTVRLTLDAPSDFPEPKTGTVYIVSSMLALHLAHRPDVYAPDTGRTAIRDANGQIQSVTRLVQYAPMAQRPIAGTGTGGAQPPNHTWRDGPAILLKQVEVIAV